jgi:phage terminase Nu1 subunit (DNA packaging protein)
MNQDTIGALVGLTSRRIRQLEKEGTGPQRLSDGSYDPVLVGKWIRERILSELGVANDGQAYDYEAERARLTKAQADKAEMERDELRGALVRVPSVESHWQGMVASMRARLLSLPSKVAAQVAGPDRLQEVQERVQTLVYEALEEISADGVPDEARARNAAHAGGEGKGHCEATA